MPFDMDNHTATAGCWRYCKIHWYWNFAMELHLRLPAMFSYHSETTGWRNVDTYVGPPAWLPKRPTQQQMTNMAAYCPHTQGDLTCGTCLRHTFRPMEI